MASIEQQAATQVALDSQPQFSIYEELWHDCWLAATAAARTKRRQVDYDIRQRIGSLMQHYGPQTEMPLTLRVYGTMLKGFCVLNNDRVRGLHVDCERLVLTFSQRGDDGAALRLAPTKRRHVDAMTLDLDVGKVREAEAFDWTPLEPGDLLQLPSQLLEGAPPSQQLPGAQQQEASSLLLRAALLDESFPAIDVPPTEPLDLSLPLALPPPAQPPVLPTLRLDDMDLELQLPDVFAASQGALAPAPPPRRLLPKLLEPGHVLGFDAEVCLQHDEIDVEASVFPLSGPLSYFELLPDEVPGRFGALAFLLDVTGAAAAAPRAPRAALPAIGWQPPARAPPAEWGEAEAREPPLEAARGADEELARALGAGAPAEAAEPSKKRHKGEAPRYDDHTAKVGEVLRRYVAASAGAERCITLDDMLPPGKTDRATAARTFHALLTLATAGELVVDQRAPYVPVAIAVA